MREDNVLGDVVVSHVDKFQFLYIEQSYYGMADGWHRGGDQADDVLAIKGRTRN